MSLSLDGCSDCMKLERFLSCPVIMTKETICLVRERCGKDHGKDEKGVQVEQKDSIKTCKSRTTLLQIFEMEGKKY